MPTIRTTLEPRRDVEVTDKELVDLVHWNLVASYAHQGPAYVPVERPERAAKGPAPTSSTQEKE